VWGTPTRRIRAAQTRAPLCGAACPVHVGWVGRGGDVAMLARRRKRLCLTCTAMGAKGGHSSSGRPCPTTPPDKPVTRAGKPKQRSQIVSCAAGGHKRGSEEVRKASCVYRRGGGCMACAHLHERVCQVSPVHGAHVHQLGVVCSRAGSAWSGGLDRTAGWGCVAPLILSSVSSATSSRNCRLMRAVVLGTVTRGAASPATPMRKWHPPLSTTNGALAMAAKQL